MRTWHGRSVRLGIAISDPKDLRPVTLELGTETASALANSLRRLNNTHFGLPVDVHEIMNALDYVLTGDPASTARHKEMERGKGMEPSGGYRAPDGEREVSP
jgi:hypothetical protein